MRAKRLSWVMPSRAWLLIQFVLSTSFISAQDASAGSSNPGVSLEHAAFLETGAGHHLGLRQPEDAFRLAESELDDAFDPTSLMKAATSNPGKVLAGVGGIAAVGGIAMLAASSSKTNRQTLQPAAFGAPKDMAMTFGKDQKCVMCEFILQKVDEALRNDPYLNYIGPNRDFPFDDTGSIFGSPKHLSQMNRGRTKLPSPPQPHGIDRSNRDFLASSDPAVKPPAMRLTPAAVANGQGGAEDAMAMETARKAALAAKALEAAQQSLAVPGSNSGASFEGGIRSMADYGGGPGAVIAQANDNGGVVPARPVILSPVDPNARLIPAAHLMDNVAQANQAPSGPNTPSFIEVDGLETQVHVPTYLTSAFYFPAEVNSHDITSRLSAQGITEFNAKLGKHANRNFEGRPSFLETSAASAARGDIPSDINADVGRFRAALDQGLNSVGDISADRFLQPTSDRLDASTVADRIVARVEDAFAIPSQHVFAPHKSDEGVAHVNSLWPTMSEGSIDAVERARRAAHTLSEALQKLHTSHGSIDERSESRAQSAGAQQPMRFKVHRSSEATDVEESLDMVRRTPHSSQQFRSSLLGILDVGGAEAVDQSFSDEYAVRAMDEIITPHHFERHQSRLPLRVTPDANAKYGNLAKYLPAVPGFSSAQSRGSAVPAGQDSTLDEDFASFARAAVDQTLKNSQSPVLLEVAPTSSALQSAVLDASLIPALDAATVAATELQLLSRQNKPSNMVSAAHLPTLEQRFVQRAGTALMEATDDLREAEQEKLSADVERRIQEIFHQATAEQARFAGQGLTTDPTAMGNAVGDAAGVAIAGATAKVGQVAASVTEVAGTAGSAAIRVGIPAAANAASAAMKAGASAAEGLERGVNVAVEAVGAAGKMAKQTYAKGQELYKEYAPIVADAAKKAGVAMGKAANKGALYASAGLDKATGVISKWDPSKAFVEKPYSSWGNADAPIGQYPERGKFGDREHARRLYRIAQQMRYQQLYHAMMFAMESTCKNELPKSMFAECRPVYAFAEQIADWLMHGYYVDEICEKIQLCSAGFFDATPED